MSSTPKPTSSENIVAQKFDRCLADLIVKSGVGFSAGVIASVILFRRAYTSVAFVPPPRHSFDHKSLGTFSLHHTQGEHGPSHSVRASAREQHTPTATVRSTPHGYRARASSPTRSSRRTRARRSGLCGITGIGGLSIELSVDRGLFACNVCLDPSSPVSSGPPRVTSTLLLHDAMRDE
ncbi:hypothetical protein VTO73DRAFT_12435 [Trametes versicolor]